MDPVGKLLFVDNRAAFVLAVHGFRAGTPGLRLAGHV
jgi:hypothetical protein